MPGTGLTLMSGTIMVENSFTLALSLVKTMGITGAWATAITTIISAVTLLGLAALCILLAILAAAGAVATVWAFISAALANPVISVAVTPTLFALWAVKAQVVKFIPILNFLNVKKNLNTTNLMAKTGDAVYRTASGAKQVVDLETNRRHWYRPGKVGHHLSSDLVKSIIIEKKNGFLSNLVDVAGINNSEMEGIRREYVKFTKGREYVVRTIEKSSKIGVEIVNTAFERKLRSKL